MPSRALELSRNYYDRQFLPSSPLCTHGFILYMWISFEYNLGRHPHCTGVNVRVVYAVTFTDGLKLMRVVRPATDAQSAVLSKSDQWRKFWTLSLYLTDDHQVRTPLRGPQIIQRIPSRHPLHPRRLLIVVLPH